MARSGSKDKVSMLRQREISPTFPLIFMGYARKTTSSYIVTRAEMRNLDFNAEKNRRTPISVYYLDFFSITISFLRYHHIY